MCTISRASSITCCNWQVEGILRLLLNTLHPDVAEKPEELVVYGTGKAIRDRRCLEATVTALRTMGPSDTLLMQSGKPVAVFPTHPWAPRVVMVNSMLVPAWATWDNFRELERRGLTMYGQTTAGTWAFIGTQGILEGTYTTFAQVARLHFGGTLRGRLVLTSGLGAMGRAQPVAITANGGVALVVEADAEVLERGLRGNHYDIMVEDLDRALDLVRGAAREGRPLSVGLLGNAANVYPELVRRRVIPDVVTDQTAAHDLLNGYIPGEIDWRSARTLRVRDPERYLTLARRSLVRHLEAMLELQAAGAVVFDYGNNIRGQGYLLGVKDAFSIPGFVQAYIRPLLCEGRGPFRWLALSGEPMDIYRIDEVVVEKFGQVPMVRDWIRLAQEIVWFQGLPARVCWLDPRERVELALAVNGMVRKGSLKAPVAFTRDHLDGGAMASPNRETEGMPDGSDAIADWPVLNALLNASCGATMVSVCHGGGVGIGYSIHSGVTVIADGEEETEERLQRVFAADPGIGVIRHAQAGLEAARAAQRRLGLKMIDIA